MKIIHTADLHLGSKIEAGFKTISDERKREVRNTFLRLVEYAKNNDVHHILLSGDIFDSDKPFKKDKDFFYSLIKSNPDIYFYYLKGNHDQTEIYNETFDNLKTFSNEWTSYEIDDDVVINGIEIDKSNYSSFYSSLRLEKNKKNIVMIHGQISDSISINSIKLSKLKDKNIDYLALGHVHKHQEGTIDNRGEYVYPGCLEGRGFDEEGEKGFVLLNVNEKITHQFIPFSERTIQEVEVDISKANCIIDILKIIKEKIVFNTKDIYRIILCGDISGELEFNEADIEKGLDGLAYFIDVKNNTLPMIDQDKYKNDLSLRGEFVRKVYENEKLTDEEKRKIVALGLNVLSGREVNL